MYSDQTSLIPTSWSEILLPTAFPVLGVFFLFLLIGLSLAALIELTSVERRELKALTIGVLIPALLSGAYLFGAWGADGMEIIRHMYPVLVLIPYFLIVAPPFALRYVDRMRTRPLGYPHV